MRSLRTTNRISGEHETVMVFEINNLIKQFIIMAVMKLQSH